MRPATLPSGLHALQPTPVPIVLESRPEIWAEKRGAPLTFSVRWTTADLEALHEPPELVVEVLSPGAANERRDRDAKLKLYARRGVDEYWLVDWQRRRVELYRRDGPAFRLGASLTDADQLQSPLLPGFAHAVDR